MRNYKLYSNIFDEKPCKNDDTFAGSLGLNEFQETHKMSADVDKIIR